LKLVQLDKSQKTKSAQIVNLIVKIVLKDFSPLKISVSRAALKEVKLSKEISAKLIDI